jgi:fructose-1,6-bisphosphatase
MVHAIATNVIDRCELLVCCNRVIFDNFRKCGSVAVAASEEKPQELDMGGEVSVLHNKYH